MWKIFVIAALTDIHQNPDGSLSAAEPMWPLSSAKDVLLVSSGVAPQTYKAML